MGPITSTGFTLSSGKRDGRAVIHVTGNLDGADATDLREQLRTLLRTVRNRRVIIDLSQVPHADANGLAVLVGGYRWARERGIEIVIAAPCPQVARTLRLTGLNRLFSMYPSTTEAVAGRAA
ncbi:MAG TPA: STAS domain-containing protein [Streptosporangiaceae bacterium]|jgi:anti-sigma B factor antagonist